LGTEYEVLEYVCEGAVIGNLDTGEERAVEVYKVMGNGDIGWLPTICFGDE